MYCGIRGNNKCASRYRLSLDEIVACAKLGAQLGYKTFVLQGGEDPYFTDDKMIEIITRLKANHPEHAITLSIGERSYASYKRMYEAGADRYLLRHETANKSLYEKIHPGASFENRKQCLYDLKTIGYQVGTGFLVGIPGQTTEDLVEDLLLAKQIDAQMCGIGPFIPHKDTPFKDEQQGSVEDTLNMIALTRLLLPKALIPATTALATAREDGRIKGIRAGANVVMPNLSPSSVRDKYTLYDGKLYTGIEAAESKQQLEQCVEQAGFCVVNERGDFINWRRR